MYVRVVGEGKRTGVGVSEGSKETTFVTLGEAER